MPLAKRTDYGDAMYAGASLPFSTEIDASLQAALLCGFDFVVTPLVRPDYRPPPAAPPPGACPGQLVPPFQREDVLYLPSSARVSQVGCMGAHGGAWGASSGHAGPRWLPHAAALPCPPAWKAAWASRLFLSSFPWPLTP